MAPAYICEYILIFFSWILFYGRVKGAIKTSNQFVRFMKDMKVLMLDKVYVTNVLGIFLTCFTYLLAYVATFFQFSVLS